MSRSRTLDAVSSNYCLVAILAVALIVRLGLAAYVQRTVDNASPPRFCLISGDAEGYWELAQKIASGKDYAISDPPRYVLRVPGFPLVLAFSQLACGDSPMAARCLLACIGTAACGFTFWLGRELVDSQTGLIAAAYVALSPTQALFSVLMLSETTFAAVLLLSLIATARLARHARTSSSALRPFRIAVVAGILIGVATLVRPTWLYAGLLISAGVSMATWDRSLKSLPRLVVIASGTLVGIAVSLGPWVCRNYNVTGHFVPTTLWVGASLYDGLRPGATGDSDMKFVEDDDLRSRMNEYEMDREYRRRAWEFVSDHPSETARLALLKQVRYWSLVPNAAQFQNKWLQGVVLISILPLMLFGLLGFWGARKDLVLIILAFGPLFVFAAMHLLFVGSLRYRLPAEFPLAIAAAVGLQAILRRNGLPVAGEK